MILSVFFA